MLTHTGLNMMLTHNDISEGSAIDMFVAACNYII